MTRDEMREKLTDYAVGELAPAERGEIERALEADAELRAELDAIRETVALVSACPAPSVAVKEARLSTERVDAILSRIVTTPARSKRWWAGPAMLAAGALIACGLSLYSAWDAGREREAVTARLNNLKRAVLNSKQGAGQNLPVSLNFTDTANSATIANGASVDDATVLALLQGTTSGWAAPTGEASNFYGLFRSSVLESDIKLKAGEIQSRDQRVQTAHEAYAQEELRAVNEKFRKLSSDYTALVAEQQKLQSNNNDVSKRNENLNKLRAVKKELRQAQKELISRKRSLEQNANGAGTLGHLVEESSSTEEYNPLVDNPFNRPFDAPLSTFSIDVDTASYANVRRFLNEGQLPPPDSVRLEELVNYFHYAYVPPAGAEPFSVALEAHAAPWEPKHQLVRIGLQGKEIELVKAPAANLVFLVDVSGSMAPEDRLPLVQKSLHLLTENLREQDKVGMVVYAGAAGVVLPPTSGAQKQDIASAIDRLSAGGSTNGAQGIEAAYQLAAANFVKDGVNRVILCTDGDFNVGVTSEGDLDRLIEEKRKTGVFLSVLGFGRGNYADARMQGLAQKGNGNAAYIDSLKEAQKVLVEQATGTLITIAKDVKIQVEFNPAKVAAYRLIGYESRLLAAQDFNDDKKDAGEIGAGHQVTALYEVIPAGQNVPESDVDALKYQETAKVIVQGAAAAELCTVKLRYKAPDGDVSRKIEFALADPGLNAAGASTDFEFAASVAAFAMCLRDSEYKGQANFGLVKELAMAGLGDDAKGYRREFVELVKKAGELAEAKKKAAEEKK